MIRSDCTAYKQPHDAESDCAVFSNCKKTVHSLQNNIKTNCLTHMLYKVTKDSCFTLSANLYCVKMISFKAVYLDTLFTWNFADCQV